MRRLRRPAGRLSRLLRQKAVAAGVVVTAATAGAIFAWAFRGAPVPGGVVTAPVTLGIDLDAPWPTCTILAGATGTGNPSGADGVDVQDANGDGFPDVATGHEQGLVVTGSFHPGYASVCSTWPTVTLPGSGPNLCSAEDAIWAYLDDDDGADIVVACETGAVRVSVFFGPEPPNNTIADLIDPDNWTRVDIAASAGNRSMRAAVADITGDGINEIIVGGKENGPCNGTTASVGYYSSSTPRDPNSWTFTSLAPAGWIMQMYVRDVTGDGRLDIVYSDRERIDCPTIDNTRRGIRFLDNAVSGWVQRDISALVEGGPQGDHKWFSLFDRDGDGDYDIVGCRSSDVVNTSYLFLNGGGFLSWTAVPLPQPSSVGQCQHAIAKDFDEDGTTDFFFTYSNAQSVSGMAWSKESGSALVPAVARGEVSGVLSVSADVKFDNGNCDWDIDGDGDLDCVTSEQHLASGTGPGLGVIFAKNPLGPIDPEVGADDGDDGDDAPPGERDTVACTLLTSGSTSTDAASQQTASVAPGANRVVYATIATATGAGPTAPTATGNGLTWASAATVTYSSGNRRITALRALGATPSAGVITFDFAAQTQTSFAWSVVECDGVDTTGTSGSGATVQSVTQTATAAVTLTATLAALEHANNVALCMTGLDTNASVTPDADFAELSDNGVANGNSTLAVSAATNQTACTPTFATANAGALAIEVKAGTL